MTADGETRPPRQVLWELSDLTAPLALRAVAGLRIADLVATRAATVAELVDATGADPAGLAAVLGVLEQRGVFTIRDGKVGLTEVGELLRSDHPHTHHPQLDPDGVRARLDGAYAALPTTVRTGDAAYAQVYGRPFWDDLDHRPDLSDAFDQSLAEWAARWASAAAADPLWDGVGHVVDVGGGTGRLAAAIARARPEVRVTIVERGHTVRQARSTVEAAGLDGRVTVVEQDAFSELPAADGYVLAQVVHNCAEAEAVRLLSVVAAAGGPGAKVALVERLPRPGLASGLEAMDLLMFVLFAAQERSAEDYRSLAARAGIRVVDTRPLSDEMSLIECVVDPGRPQR